MPTPYALGLTAMLAIQHADISNLLSPTPTTITAATRAYSTEILTPPSPTTATYEQERYAVVDRTFTPVRNIPDRPNTTQPIQGEPNTLPYRNGGRAAKTPRRERRFPHPPKKLGNTYGYLPNRRDAYFNTEN